MKPVKFKGANLVVAKDQEEYIPFPVYKNPDPEHSHYYVGEMTACWKLTWWERIKLLFTGHIWHSIWTFNRPLQPQRLTTTRPKEIPHDQTTK